MQQWFRPHIYMDELCKHYTQWKKPFTKDHILHDSIFKMSRIRKGIGSESSGSLGLGRGGRGLSFGKKKSVLNSLLVIVA